jgi:transcriptional regulator with XRE-family HTH domain
MDSIYQTIGRRLREQRTLRGMTQRELAEKCNLSVAFLSYLETGRRKGSLQTYATLAEALDLGLDQLFKTRASKKKPTLYQDPRPSLVGLSTAEAQAVQQLIRTLRRRR